MVRIILDRDGVINRDSDAYIKSLAEWQPLPGSIDAIARLSRNGHRLVVATNQSGLGRGLFDLDDLEAIHGRLQTLVAEQGGHLEGIFYCPHIPEEHCDCRKPRPGLFDAIARELNWELAGSVAVGDSLRDLEAGLARGCRPVLVRTGKGEATLARLSAEQRAGVAVYPDLAAFADAVMEGVFD